MLCEICGATMYIVGEGKRYWVCPKCRYWEVYIAGEDED